MKSAFRQYASIAISNHPLDGLDNAAKSSVAQQISRIVDEERGYRTQDAAPGTNINGQTAPSGECDYERLLTHEGQEIVRRCKVKFAKPLPKKVNWAVTFRHVKFDNSDDLILMIHVPWGVELWEYNVQAKVGVSTMGKLTQSNGHQIQCYTPAHAPDLNIACAAIRAKLEQKQAASLTCTALLDDEIAK